MADAAMSPPGGPLFHAFGLVIRSDVPLAGLRTTPPAPVDVEIVRGTVPDLADAPEGYHVTGGGTLLTVPDVARYWIENGRRITVAALPTASDRNVRLFLLGSALGAILHQRGLVPLHANAVEIGGRAVAFMGESGAGKSTLAAWFLDCGRAVLTDDVCVIAPDDAGTPIAHRGLIRLRLWREAMAHSGRVPVEAARSFDDQDKFDVAMPDGRHAPATLPLGAAVLLERAEDDEPFAIERLRGMQAVGALIANVYRGGYAARAGRTAELLAACADIARHVPVLRVRRGWGFDRFDEQALRIEAAVHDAMTAGIGVPPVAAPPIAARRAHG